MLILAVALGGALGSVARYLMGLAVPRTGHFPAATLAINVLGSLLLGALVRVLQELDGGPALRAFLLVGVCGGFTTFSTFAFEGMGLFDQGQWRSGALYVLASVLGSLAAVAAGMWLARAGLHPRG